MDLGPLKQFVLWRGEKRIVMGEEDLQISKISSVFKVVPETLYLEDDFTRIARFPSDITGAFDATFWQDKLTLQVMGESSNVPGLCSEALIPSPQQFGIGRSTATATQVKAHTSVSSKLSTFQGKGKTKASPSFKRVVFFAHFEDKEIVKTHTAHLRLGAEECNVNDVAKLVKEYLNMDEDLVIVDVHGFEIMDSESTRGEDFWNVPAKKIYAITLSDYQKKKKQADRSRGENKRYKPEREPLDLDVLDEISEKLDNLAKVCQSNSILSTSIKENFKCCICFKMARPITVSGCCQRLLGCTPCVERWYGQDGRCPVCKSDDGREKYFSLKGVEDFAVIISKLDESIS